MPLNPLTSHYEESLAIERGPVQFQRRQAAINYTLKDFQEVVNTTTGGRGRLNKKNPLD